MQSLGLEVNISKRNSLFIGDRKFSGHAEHIFHDRVLHHGTILWNTDLEALENSLVPSKSFSSKAMESVRSEVCNLAPLLPDYSGIQQFTENLVDWLLAFYSGRTLYKLQDRDLDAISTLTETKYKTWEWNFGYSPAYTFSALIPLRQGSEPVIVKVENGRIVGIEPCNEALQQPVAAKLKSMLGLLHREEDIDTFVKNNRKALELDGLNTVNFTEAFFR
jgi:lipoate-protein ligase A